MPIRNEVGFVERSLRAVLAPDCPPERLEVLVADGLSTDGTRDLVAAMCARARNLQLINNRQVLVSTGLNRALADARGEIMVRVDRHTIVDRDYVSRCVEVLQTSDADCVGGPMRAVGEGWFGRAVAAATSSPFGVGDARFHYSRRQEWVDTVYLGAW